MREPDSQSGGTFRSDGAPPLCGGGTFICLLSITALALAVRLYRIEQQSVWTDDFLTAGCLGVKGLSAQLALFRFWNPDCTPLDFLLQHLWAMLTGMCPWKLRLMPIFFGVLCVPIIFSLGKAVCGKGTGLLAALFFALSPFHAWHGQTMRPYALVSLLALLAMYSCLRVATHGGWKWWFANLAAGFMLLWSHPFTVFFLVAEFAFLIWSVGPRKVLLLVWAPLVGVSALSVLLWLLPTLAYVPSAQEDPDYLIPSPAQIAVGFLGNDAILVSSEFPVSAPRLPFLTPSQGLRLAAVHPLADTLLCGYFGLALILAITSLLIKRTKTAGGPVCPKGPAPRESVQRTGVILLLCVSLLPVLQILLLTVLWRPCFAPRHTLYCSFPLYILLAAALLRMRRPILFGASLALILILYAYQLAIFTTATTRSDWISAATQIKADLRHNDLILVTGILPLARENFCFNAGDLPVSVESAYAPQEVCERVLQCLAVQATSPAENRRVWAVMEGIGWDKDMLSPGFEASFQQSGISFRSWFWPGLTGMSLYLFERPASTLPIARVRPAFPLPVEYVEVLEQMGPRVLKLDRDVSLDALRRVLYWQFPPSMKWTALLSLMLTEKGSPEFGLAVARVVLDREPAFGFGHFAEAVALAALGSQQEARDAFQEAFALDRATLCVFEPAVRAWFDQRNIREAQKELDQLKSIGYPSRALSAVLSRCKGLTP